MSWAFPDTPEGSPAASAAAGRAVEGSVSSGVRIRINLPAYRIDVLAGDSSWSAPVAVGTPRYPTPRGEFRIRTIEWNPWWIPPESEWARNERPTPPGANNPMGKVKLQVTGLIYLHGTPTLESLGRAASHACVRMSDSTAVRLALLIHRDVLHSPPPDTLMMLMASLGTRRYAVDSLVPVEFTYLLAEVRDAQLWIYPNLYKLSGVSASADALQALADAGVDTSTVDRAVLERLRQRGRNTTASLPIEALIRR